MATSWKKVVVFLGSTRDGRVGDRVAKFVCKTLTEKKLEVVFVDPLEFDLPLLKTPVHFYPDPSKAPPKLVALNKKIAEADAIIVVSAEYNHSIPPALSNTLDYFSPKSYSNKPSAIVTYSPSLVGGARAGIQLRSMLGELGCVTVSNMFTISQVQHCFDENGVPKDTTQGSKMNSGLEKLLSQLEWWANAAKHQRENCTAF
uniref:Uncharacterized protein LOC100183100 n=1 Tax=Phallusia mammillata TaxID=59560 RepID=A0A6F9DIB2_9ASCI|nr:uncharacterized protein LOC100183100 [Phallusia mammillata]